MGRRQQSGHSWRSPGQFLMGQVSPCVTFGPSCQQRAEMRDQQHRSPLLSLLTLFTSLFSLLLAADLSEQVKQLGKHCGSGRNITAIRRSHKQFPTYEAAH